MGRQMNVSLDVCMDEWVDDACKDGYYSVIMDGWMYCTDEWNDG